MTKEVYSFEVATIPNQLLRNYINLQIEKAYIREDSFFGFSDYDDPPDYKPRIGGFNEGRWISEEEAEIYKRFLLPKNNQRPTGLYKNEADASLAVRALTGGIVLTAESLEKSGPLKKAALEGGMIVDIKEFNSEKTTFSEFINEKLKYLIK